MSSKNRMGVVMWNRKATTFILVILVWFVASYFCGQAVGEDVAVRALETQGYSNIQIMEQAWFAVGLRGCDESDAVRFTAVATNPVGKQVKLYVCSGVVLKGATIRTR